MFEAVLPFHAAQYPRRPAIWFDRGEVSYATFERDIGRMTAALADEGFPAGATVLIQVENLTLHWLLTLALERLGHPTAATVGMATALMHFEVIKPAVVLGADAFWRDTPSVQASAQVVTVTDDWIRRALTDEPAAKPARSPAHPDDLVRIVLSSGTTGAPKQIPLTREVLDRRLSLPTFGSGFYLSATPRGLFSAGVDTVGGYLLPLYCWHVGGVALLTSTLTEETLERGRPNMLGASPAALASMLRLFPDAFRGPERVQVVVGGSAAPAPLIRELQERGGAEVIIAYGSTECTSVANWRAERSGGRPGGVGYVTPWTELQIVDEDHRPLPAGESGRIRVRGVGMVTGYLGQDPSADSPFLDGWFYPGDLGHLDPDGVLVVDGRADDVINAGGVKLSATRIEETALECPGVTDAAVLALPMTNGETRLHCAVVTGADYDAQAVQQRLLDVHNVRATLVPVPQIARNGMGKIMRKGVKEAILAEARRQLVPQPS